MVIICVVFVICPGCTSLQQKTVVPTTQTIQATVTPTTVVTPMATPPVSTFPSRDNVSYTEGTLDPDAAFNVFFVKSQEEIVNKTQLVLQAMVPGTMSVQAVYSPSLLYLTAEDLGFTTEKYYDQVMNMETYTPETEAKRIAYLQFLYSAENAAYHIADAAEAESFGDYQNALGNAIVAKIDLQNIEVNPDLPPTIPYNALNVYVSEYIGGMRDKVIASEIKTSSREDRFPLLF